MASELLLGALLACQHSTFTKVAAKRRADIHVKEIHGEIHFNDHAEIEAINTHFVLRGGDETARATIVRLASKSCTISNALAVPVNSTHGLETEEMFRGAGFHASNVIPDDLAISK